MINEIKIESKKCPRCGGSCNYTIYNSTTKEEFCSNCMTESEKLSIEYDLKGRM